MRSQKYIKYIRCFIRYSHFRVFVNGTCMSWMRYALSRLCVFFLTFVSFATGWNKPYFFPVFWFIFLNSLRTLSRSEYSEWFFSFFVVCLPCSFVCVCFVLMTVSALLCCDCDMSRLSSLPRFRLDWVDQSQLWYSIAYKHTRTYTEIEREKE